MKELIKLIQSHASQFADDGIQLRRHMHRFPELSFQEFETSKFIKHTLESYGIEYTDMPGDDGKGTGLIAEIHGSARAENGSGGGSATGGGSADNAAAESSSAGAPVLALRADMDALPVVEENNIDFKSENPGVMHACGHDAHTAILLTAARILNTIRDQFSGTIRLIFQPGEERTPGGALSLIRQGALKGADAILGEHVNPALPAGTAGFRPGLMMASADEIYMTVKGLGGHAATPHLLIDPVLITSHIIIALQQVVSRQANPEIPSVLSFGRVDAPGAMNVIPSSVTVEGTFRTVNEEWRETALESIRKIAQTTAESMGGSCEIEILRGYPVLENDAELTGRSRSAAAEYLGEENIVDLPLVMWAEDFAYYNREVNGCFYNLGIGNVDKGWTSPLHSSTMMIDESALQIGSGLMAWLAICELQAMAK